MVPSILVELEGMPLTVNGKLDRKALPEPDFVNEASYVAPITELEISLSKIFAEVLGLEKVGITDDFFRIGGDSILSIQLSSKLRKRGYECSVRDIFDTRNVSKLASYIESIVDVEVEIIKEEGTLTGGVGLLPIQEWFFDNVKSKDFADYNHWNQSFMVKVPALDISKIESVVAKLVEHHDILRVNYNISFNTQQYNETIVIPKIKNLNVNDYTQEELHKELTSWQSDFDIEKGRLFRVGYLESYSDGSARLYFALHHLIVDAVSWRILIEDFRSLYNDEELALKATSYRQYVDIVRDYTNSHREQESYWSGIVKSLPSYEVARKTPTVSTAKLDRESTTLLLQEGNKAYHTEINDLLLTALLLSLKDINGLDKQGVTLEGHGREHLVEGQEIGNTVGWFTSMYPVLLEDKGELSTTIKYVKESLRAIKDKGIGFGSFAVSDESSIRFKDLPTISFNYLGQFDAKEGLWQIISEDSGVSVSSKNKDHNIVNINGMVVDGQLSFSVVTQLGQDITDKLSVSLGNNLKLVQAHTSKLVEQGISHKTPSDYNSDISLELLDRLQIQDNEVEYIYSANSLQQGFIYHALSNPDDDAYRVQLVFDYKQELDVDRYIKSWGLAIAKHPILRTAFNWDEDIIQVVYRNGDLEYNYHDISDQDDKEQAIQEIQEEDRWQGFDLTKPTQLRLHIIKQSDDLYTIIKSEHHSIADGWSGPILLSDIHKYYHDLSINIDPQVQEDDSYLRVQEYIQNNRDKANGYWQENLTDIEVNDLSVLLTTDKNINDIKSLDDNYTQTLTISGDIYNKIKDITSNLGITTNTLLQFVWHKLINIYTQDSQTIVGTTISGRDIAIDGIEDSVGLYINTLPLLVDWGNTNTIEEQLKYIHNQITNLSTHSYADLSKIQNGSERLFHSLFVYENYPIPESNGELAANRLLPELRYAVEKLDYPLGIVAYEHNNSLIVGLKSSEEVLTQNKAKEHLNKLSYIVNQLIDDITKRHNEITTLTQQDYQTIVYDWNYTDSDYPNDRTIYELFEEQVEKNPNNVALVFEEKQLTYQELNKKANQLARYIRKQYKEVTNQELQADTLIPLCLERSLDMVIAIVAVMKSGGAYVPMDPEYPVERFRHILADTEAKL
ncbi:condensation domain-containing protein, partial [Francisella sciaenopsi]|uniref:condensation domain-containing protein n=1 Tax=Francisella sciaenopsi TaxID=3055034 RepID=UPI0038B3422A